MAGGWGLGYFGQPHIVTKFMGIRNIHEITKSKCIGMTWMLLSLVAATIVGLVGIAFFKEGLSDAEQTFVQMVRLSFHPFVIGLILCAVLAATINAMSSQVLVLSSSIAEDFYKRLFRKNASSGELLFVSRAGVVFVALLAYFIAFAKISSIYSLVFYAWSGLGSSFGPLLILSLYSKKINKYGAWSGIVAGGVIAAIWPYFSKDVPTMLPAFTTSFLLILIVSRMTRHAQLG
jgi:sodium/proline symporter